MSDVVDYFSPETTEICVRPGDLDRLQHVNNAAVLELLEAARWEWLASKRLRNEGGVAPVIFRAEIDYLQELSCERLAVTTELLRPGKPGEEDEGDIEWGSIYRAVMRQQIVSTRRQSVAVKAHVHLGFIDVEARTLEPLAAYLATTALPSERAP